MSRVTGVRAARATRSPRTPAITIPPSSDQEEEKTDALERPLGLGERSCDLHGRARAIGESEDSEVGCRRPSGRPRTPEPQRPRRREHGRRPEARCPAAAARARIRPSSRAGRSRCASPNSVGAPPEFGEAGVRAARGDRRLHARSAAAGGRASGRRPGAVAGEQVPGSWRMTVDGATCGSSRSPTARAGRPDRTAAHRGRPHAAPDPLFLILYRGRRDRASRRPRARLPRRARAGAAADRGDRERDRDAATSRSGSTSTGRRAQPAGASFNTMLAALEESTRAQRQLVADASHELRTPLTSLRTNIEVLAERARAPAGGARAAAARRRRAARRDDDADRRADRARARRAATAASRRTCGSTCSPPTPSSGRGGTARASSSRPISRSRSSTACRRRIERAVGNLLDNAAKWSPPGGEVEVAVRDGEVIVRDHGPGIADEDLPYVFDRFYRAQAARGLPGLRARPRDRAPGRRVARRRGRRRARGRAAGRRMRAHARQAHR